MTLFRIMCSLRQRLLSALEADRRKELLELFHTFSMLKEATYGGGNKQFTMILAEMEAAAQDGVIGVRKQGIATIEEIEAAIKEA